MTITRLGPEAEEVLRSTSGGPPTPERLQQSIARLSKAIEDSRFTALERAAFLAERGSKHQILCDLVSGDILRAVADFDRALQVITPAVNEPLAAQLQLSRADALFSRRYADPGAIHLAIEGCRAALAGLTPGRFVQLESNARVNIAVALLERTTGSDRENADAAITELVSAQRLIRPQDDLPLLAKTERLLSESLLRASGDPERNAEESLARAARALEMSEVVGDLQAYAGVLMSLAAALLAQRTGDRAAHFEQALAVIEHAVATFVSLANERDTAAALLMKARILINYTQRDREDRLDEAIAAANTAVGIANLLGDSDLRVRALSAMANAYQLRSRGDAQDNLRRSVAILKDALAQIGASSGRDLHAKLHADLGSVLQRLVTVDDHDAIAEMMEHLGEALRIQEELGNHRECARVHLNRSNALRDNVVAGWQHVAAEAVRGYDEAARLAGNDERLQATIRIDRAAALVQWGGPENLARAAQDADKVLQRSGRDVWPLRRLTALRIRGTASFLQEEWRDATAALDEAQDIALEAIGYGLNAAESRRIVIEISECAAMSALATARLGDDAEAFRKFIDGRARRLALALRLGEIALDTNDRARVEELRRQLRAAERDLETASGEQVGVILRAAREARGRLSSLLAAKSADPGPGNLADRLKGHERVAFLGIAFSRWGAAVLCARMDAGRMRVSVRLVDDTRTATIRDAASEYLHSYGRCFSGSASGDWQPSIDRMVGQLAPALSEDVGAALAGAGAVEGDRVALLAQGILSLLPLSLLPVWNGRTLGDTYAVVSSPLVRPLSARSADTSRSLAAVRNPTGDLPGTELETAMAARLFEKVRILSQKDASLENTVEALRNADHWLFATHGHFEFDEPQASGLVLANDDHLSMREIAEVMVTRGPKLVLLSACETGLHDVAITPEEFEGLPSAFLELGARSVLATLWPVTDDASALLSSRFLRLVIHDRLEPAEALRRAQLWLRNITVAELARHLTASFGAEAKDLLDWLDSLDAAATPFRSSQYWAGMVLYE